MQRKGRQRCKRDIDTVGMHNRSVMIIKTLKEEKVNWKLPRSSACLVKSKQTSSQKRTLLIPRERKKKGCQKVFSLTTCQSSFLESTAFAWLISSLMVSLSKCNPLGRGFPIYPGTPGESLLSLRPVQAHRELGEVALPLLSPTFFLNEEAIKINGMRCSFSANSQWQPL